MDIRTETVPIPNGTPTLSAYFALPPGTGKVPGVVIVHEAYGLTDNIRSIARRFAESGYAALAVDLFAGRSQVVCMFRFFGSMFFGDALNHSGIRDLKAALTWLEQHASVDSARIGAVGFCLGGNFVISWACTDQRLNVVAPFYGINPRPLEAVARACPVVGSYPENDFTRGHGEKLNAALDAHKIPHDVKIYPATGHSFFNKPRDASETAAAEDAWQRVMRFFEQHIGTRSGRQG